jgi:hypothetical protein
VCRIEAVGLRELVMSIATLPPVFDADYYRAAYPELSHLNDEELIVHFQQTGITNGLIGTSGCLRSAVVSAAQSEKSVLEIGPLNSPAMTGSNVKYLDAYDTEGLSKYASACGVDPAGVPSIDYVSPTGEFDMVDQNFAAIFSSHNIEHIPDLVRHLNNVANILNNYGRYYIICPDKRFCFDHFQPESTIADVLAAYVDKPLRHPIRTHLSHRLLTSHNDPARHWAGDHGDPVYLAGTVSLKGVLANLPTGNDYVDSHAWQFTPKSFFTIIQSLHSAGLIDLWPERVYHTPKNVFEFVAVLKKGGEAVYSDAFLSETETDGETQFEGISNQLRETMIERDNLNMKLETANTAALAAQQTLTRMKKSLAWRATKPFRSLTKRIPIR